ncbi:MAG TPA: type IX secretion system membrane protein PorP/SprF [Cyclobacteriaceae bacterium]
MIKNLFLVTFTLALSYATYAQQDPLYSQYLSNPVVINPAYTGLTNDFNTTLSIRKQWNGLDGSPSTANLNSSLSILKNTAGAGVMVISDVIGNQTTTEFYAMGSYRVRLTINTTLSFGLQAGVQDFNINKNKVTPYDKTDNLFQSVNQIKPEIGSGLILTSEKFLVGISVPRMLKPGINVMGSQENLYTQHFYLTGSYNFMISDRLTFKPAALIKYVKGAPMSVDLNPSLIVNGKVQVGALARNLNTFGLFGKALISDKFLVGYTYEIPTKKSVGPQFMTYEVTLGLRIKTVHYHKGASLL